MKSILHFTILCGFILGCSEHSRDLGDQKPVSFADSLALSLGTDTTLLVPGRHVDLEGVVNFRDLGGIQTDSGKSLVWGKIYRSGKLSGLTESDFLTLDSLGIRSVVDFRSQGEVQSEPDSFGDGVSYYHLPIGDDNWTTGDFMSTLARIPADSIEEMMVSLYSRIPLEWSEQYKAFFRIISDTSNLPLVFHCTAGKDRTGMASAMLLTILGIEDEIVRNEYELSNYYRFEENQSYLTMMEQSGISLEIARGLMGVKGKYLDAVFGEISEQHGSLEEYFSTALELSEEEKDNLRAIYLR